MVIIFTQELWDGKEEQLLSSFKRENLIKYWNGPYFFIKYKQSNKLTFACYDKLEFSISWLQTHPF